MAQSGAGASAWVYLNSLGWDGKFLEARLGPSQRLSKIFEALTKTNSLFAKQPYLAWEQLYYYFTNVAMTFIHTDKDLAYNAHIAAWACNDCRASLATPAPLPKRDIDEKEEYRKFFPDRSYELRHFLPDRIERAKGYIANLPRGLSTSLLYPEADVERFVRGIEEDYPGELPGELILPIATLKKAIEIQKSKILEVQSVGIVPITSDIYTLYTSSQTEESLLKLNALLRQAQLDARPVEPVVHQPRGDERGTEHEGARGQDQPL